MVKNKNAVKGLLVLGGVGTAAVQFIRFLKSMLKNYFIDIINKKIDQVF